MSFSPMLTTVEGLNESHHMLLHMVYLYSEGSRGANVWVRETPLLVLMYEGICEEVFDYDYAPASVKVGRRRVYMNVTQEGRDDLDDLREAGLLLSLKLTNNLNNNLTAFRLSDLGLQMLLNSGRVSHSTKKRIEDFLRLAPGPHGLKRVRWTGEHFEIYCPATGDTRTSEVTECEDVSYVTSPYVPSCMRECQFPETKSNAHRASEASQGASNIKDKLDEAIVLDRVTLLVGEWIPFGSNQVVALNDRLGSGERCQGGFLTALTDDKPDSMHYQQAEDIDLTEVLLLDFSPETYVNFEAEVHFPEDEGILQIENIGVHVNHRGNVAFGVRLEAVLDRVRDRISLDLLSRVMVDLQQDSSKLIDSLVAEHQRRLLDVAYYDDRENRDKFTLILADSIEPQMPAENYLDKEDFENELKQVLGDTYVSYDLGDREGLLVMGSSGILYVEADHMRHEQMLSAYLFLYSLSTFIRNYFNRTFILGDTLKEIGLDIDQFEKDPNSLMQIRAQLTLVGNEVVLLEEILNYIVDTCNATELPTGPDSDDDHVGLQLFEILDLENTANTLRLRTADMRKNIAGCHHKIETLREQCQVISERQMMHFQEAMNNNSKNLEDMFKAAERSGQSLEMMQVLLSGTLAFEILDRLTGEWSVLETEWAKHWWTLISSWPLLWLVVNLGLWGVMALALYSYMQRKNAEASDVLEISAKLNLPANIRKLKVLLSERDLKEENVEASENMQVRKVSWEEPVESPWTKHLRLYDGPIVNLTFEERHGFLLVCSLTFQKQTTPPLPHETELLKVFFSVLEDADVLLESDSLTQLKAEYNIAGSARYPITRNAREAAKARRDDLWARYPWLQVIWQLFTTIAGLATSLLGAIIRCLEVLRAGVVRRAQDQDAPHAHHA